MDTRTAIRMLSGLVMEQARRGRPTTTVAVLWMIRRGVPTLPELQMLVYLGAIQRLCTCTFGEISLVLFFQRNIPDHVSQILERQQLDRKYLAWRIDPNAECHEIVHGTFVL